MNVVFLTMVHITDVESHGIYTDLLRKFRNESYEVYIVTPNERRGGKPTQLIENNGVHILQVRTLNLQKTNVLEKGIGQVSIETLYKRAIKKYLKGVVFDLILYSTPPVTFPRVINFLKNNNPNASTYLLLKDIFPQNAVDLGMISQTGVGRILYRFFRNKEKLLYRLSDNIGCMSPANMEYVLKHNPELSKNKVEVAPNSLEISDTIDPSQLRSERWYVRSKLGIPLDVPVFVFGGNLGKPQGIPFLMDCLEANANRDNCFFVVIGTGTELPRLKQWYNIVNPKSVIIIDGLPKGEYDIMARTCDVGLIFLDYRFTIPNFPSRILSYMENKMPVLCATDTNTDIGKIVEENGFGYWCESNSVEAFTTAVDRMLHADRKSMGEKGYEYLCQNYLVQNTFEIIVNHLIDV